MTHRIGPHLTQQLLRASISRHAVDIRNLEKRVGPPMPRYNSGIWQMNKMLEGGWYGYTMVAASQKTGKTILTTRAAVESCRDGWKVFYCWGEGDDRMLMRRLNVCLDLRDDKDDSRWPEFMHNFYAPRFDRGQTIEDLIRWILEHVDIQEERLLIFVDSVNRLAKIGVRGGGSFFDILSDINGVASFLTSQSEGRIGFVAVSETNKRGGAVGADIEYAAEVLVQMKNRPSPGEDTLVGFKVDSRDTAAGDLGKFRFLPKDCLFEASEMESMRQKPKKKQGTLSMVVGAKAPIDDDIPF